MRRSGSGAPFFVPRREPGAGLFVLAAECPPPLLLLLFHSQTVVTGPRSERAKTASTSSVTVVTGEQLAATGERSLPRALGRAAGVWIQETNGGGGLAVYHNGT